MVKNKILVLVSVVLLIVVMSLFVSATEQNICCEKTKTGFFCQDVPQSQCASNSKTAQTSCKASSFCRPGVCYNTLQGTCLDNTPQNVCDSNGGTWSATAPAACNLGCCVLGDQASFVTLTRCKYLAGNLGLQTNFNNAITSEAQCILQVQNQDRGACVYNFEFQRTCKFTTRAECSGGVNGTGKGEFFKDKLCTADELGTNCGWTKQTTCAAGKDGVYFLDSCGNTANIYDSTKIPNTANLSQAPVEIRSYWSDVKTKDQSCSSNSANADSKSCGNCNYLLGSYCRPSSVEKVNANYGDYICADLNCQTKNVGTKLHGESWCVYDDAGTTGKSNDAVGSRFYKHVCVNGEEVVEQCADFRQEECIQDSYKLAGVQFTQAACRVNRWQDCLTQTSKDDCDNTDKRDCNWLPDVSFGNSSEGACVPKNSPGLKFWTGDEAKTACTQGNYQCIVTFEKGLFGNEKCASNCQCLDENWKQQRIAFCQALGDCGVKVNWLGQSGYKQGYNITKT